MASKLPAALFPRSVACGSLSEVRLIPRRGNSNIRRCSRRVGVVRQFRGYVGKCLDIESQQFDGRRPQHSSCTRSCGLLYIVYWWWGRCNWWDSERQQSPKTTNNEAIDRGNNA
ncbi:hypothetical protein AVEN_195089-1 [Araneus ventricosus]|uniref:Uncharacterized protein n=1 Tax=Araneus ventricosus TaxID=182803 RepID=A0A4Y2BGL9_ARAVE|nr:hypothetical protein AVEN_195089-1 [Araneus ventricosus]